MRPRRGGGKAGHEDDRMPRLPTPQYQTEEDAALADPQCPTCVFPDVPDVPEKVRSSGA